MVIVLCVEPEDEQRIDRMARQLAQSRSACIRKAIRQHLLCHGDGKEGRRQAQRLTRQEPRHCCDWTA